MANGALGGSGLIGAGGGGFLTYAPHTKKPRPRQALREKGLQELRFRFDFEGTKAVAQN